MADEKQADTPIAQATAAQDTTTPGLQFKLPDKAVNYIKQSEQANGLPEGALLGLFVAENHGFKTLAEAGPHTKSGTGARGPFQLTDSALKDAGYDPKTFKWNSFAANAEAAGKYAKIILDQTAAKGLEGVDPHVRLAGGYNLGYNRFADGVKAGTITPDFEGVDAASESIGNGKYASKYMRAFPNGTSAKSEGSTTASAKAGAEPTPQPSYGSPIIERVGPTAPSQAGGFDSAITAAKTAGGALWENLGKPVWEGISQFPGEIADNAKALSDRGAHLGLGAVDALIGSTMEAGLPPPPDFKTIDPMGVANFVTSVATPGFGGVGAPLAERLAARTLNGVTAAGSTVLNAADARAKQQATQQGVDWSGLGFGDRVSRIAGNLDTTTIADNLPSILTNAGIGFLLTPNDSAQSKVQQRRGAILGEYQQEADRVAQVNNDYVEYGQYQRRASQWETASKNVAEEQRTVLHNAKQAENEAINQAAQQAYEARLAKVQPQLDAAREITGLDVMPNDAWAFERKTQNRAARDLLMQELGVEADNPASPIFQKWLGTAWDPTPEAMRPLDPQSVESIDTVFAKIRAEAKASNRADSVFAKLGQALGDPHGVKDQIGELEGKIQALGPGGDEAKKAILEGKIQELEAQLPEPTVGDLINRVQAIDEVRRTKAFSDSATPREKKLLEDVSTMLRDPDPEKGLVTSALTPEEAKLWVQGNMVSKSWWQKKRAADLVMSAFGDSRPGASNILHAITAKESKFRKQLGDDVYQRLHELAGAIDDVMQTIPPPPDLKPVSYKTFVPDAIKPDWRPNPKMLLRTPERPDPATWKRMAEDSRGAKILEGVNTLVSKTGTMTLMALGGAAGGAYGAAHGVPFSKIALTGAATGFLLTVPAASKAFVDTVRFMDRPQSREYLNALARLTTAAMIHNAYTPQPLTEVPDPALASTPPTSTPTPRTPTKLATRPTGGPIPAPPTRERVPSGSPQALR